MSGRLEYRKLLRFPNLERTKSVFAKILGLPQEKTRFLIFCRTDEW